MRASQTPSSDGHRRTSHIFRGQYKSSVQDGGADPQHQIGASRWSAQLLLVSMISHFNDVILSVLMADLISLGDGSYPPDSKSAEYNSSKKVGESDSW
jgi:hypothetical protein